MTLPGKGQARKVKVTRRRMAENARDPKARAATEICARLTAAGHRALFAGGCVRDMVLQTPPNDYDIATSARPDQVMGLFPRTEPVGAEFGVVLVITPAGPFEVATFRADCAYEDGRHPTAVVYTDEVGDSKRRDFTANALFYDPAQGQLADYVGGLADIEHGILRAVGEPRERFAEDHLRLLRAVRFAARLGFQVEPATWEAMCALCHLAPDTSAERIRDEVLKILTEGHAREGFGLLDKSGMLEYVLPEISHLKGVEQPPRYHPEGDVFTHTLLMLEHMHAPSPTLAMGVLLHDVAKPHTKTVEDRVRFNRHDKVGAVIAESVCKRLRMSRQQTARIVWLVDQHMRLAHVPRMRESKRKRFVREIGFDELLELGRLDALASHGDLALIEWLQDYAGQLAPEEVRPDPLLTGEDLIGMGYEPGPLFSEILREVEDAQLENRIQTLAEAKAYVAGRWPLG